MRTYKVIVDNNLSYILDVRGFIMEDDMMYFWNEYDEIVAVFNMGSIVGFVEVVPE